MDAEQRGRLIDYSFVMVMAACLALGAAAVFGSGVYTSLYGIRISTRTLLRPLLVAFAAALLWLHRADARQERVAAVWTVASKHPRAVAFALAVLTFLVAWRASAFQADAADSYGYVSQAHLWAAGNLIQREPLSLEAPWPDPEWTLAPLGYRPGPERGTIVPTYAPGLPIFMAGLMKPFGAFGPFLAVPLLGSVAIVAAFVLGKRVGGDACGLVSAVLLLSSPIFLFQLKEPMSDVPVTAWWLLALVLITTAAPPALFAGGLAASAAILTRPNLAPLAAVLAVFVLAYSAPRFGGRLVNAVVFLSGMIPGCIGVALVNARLYGSPLSSGYGDTSSLFNVDFFWPNLSRYSRWLIESETPFIALAVFGMVLLRRADRRLSRLSALFAAFSVVLYACYAFYLPFDNWTFLRFLLPGVALLLILCSVGVLYVFGKLSSLLSRLALAAALVLFAVWRWEVNGPGPVSPHDRRFGIVAEYVRTELPQNAIVFSMMHSGTVRYYAGRSTLRWDWLAAEWLEPSLEFLLDKGYHPYLLIDDWERSRFIERFAGHSKWAALEWTPVATYRGRDRSDLFDLVDRNRTIKTQWIDGPGTR